MDGRTFLIKSTESHLNFCMTGCLNQCNLKERGDKEKALSFYQAIDKAALRVLEASVTKKDGTLDFAVKGGKRKAFEKQVLKLKAKCEKALKKNGWL